MKVVEVLKAVAPALLAFGVAWLMFGHTSGGDGCKRDDVFKFTTKDGVEISSKAEGCKPDTLSLIHAMLSNSQVRDVILTTVRREEKLFVMHDPAWVSQLGVQLCPTYNDTLSPGTKATAARECLKNLVASELRSHQRARRVPFMRMAEEKAMGVPPARYRPVRGTANGCKGENGLHTKFVRVSNLSDSQRYVDVEVTGSYSCDDGNTYPDIQLGADDALDVLGGKKVPDKLTPVLVIEQDRR